MTPVRSGLANRSDQVGRNFMNHNCSALLALSTRRNRSVYQKTLYLNDWYSTGGPNGEPLGNVQLLGRVSGPILAAQTGLPRALASLISRHAIDFYVMSEDLPDPDSRVTLKGEDIVLNWTRTNWAAHEALVATLKAALRRAGFPVCLSKAFDRERRRTNAARRGWGPTLRQRGVALGRAHDHANLWIADASVLPTSAAVNPSLTIAAQALRVADADPGSKPMRRLRHDGDGAHHRGTAGHRPRDRGGAACAGWRIALMSERDRGRARCVEALSGCRGRFT
jgi:choline dehydrogenase-like flavoprotein